MAFPVRSDERRDGYRRLAIVRHLLAGRAAAETPRTHQPVRGHERDGVYAGACRSRRVFLVRFHNGVQPVANSYDGFLIGAGGGKPPLDVRTKLFKVSTETDVWRGRAAVRVPDTNVTHTWEIAGASHVGAFLMSPNQNDFRAVLGRILERDVRPQFS